MNANYVLGVGPAAPAGSKCSCGRDAVAQCEGCGAVKCRGCWWRHGTAADPHQMGGQNWVGIGYVSAPHGGARAGGSGEGE